MNRGALVSFNRGPFSPIVVSSPSQRLSLRGMSPSGAEPKPVADWIKNITLCALCASVVKQFPKVFSTCLLTRL
jgi:hypothetical protein